MLILDDNEFRHKQFKKKFHYLKLTHVYTAEECIDKLKENNYDYISLDHDLGGTTIVESGDGTGYEVAKWINENLDYKPKIYVHSLNPIGRDNIINVLKDFNVESKPFFWS
jgi:hypothetical protein